MGITNTASPVNMVTQEEDVDEDELTNTASHVNMVTQEEDVDEDELTNIVTVKQEEENEDMWEGFDIQFSGASAADHDHQNESEHLSKTQKISFVSPLQPIEKSIITEDDSESLSSDDGDAHAGWNDDKDFLHIGDIEDDDVDLMVHHYHVG